MPQQAGRLVLSKRKRLSLVAAQTAVLHEHTWTALNLPAGAPTNLEAMAFAESQMGLPYRISYCRCSSAPCYGRDCSGLVYASINSAFQKHGHPSNLCGSSFALAALGRDYGTGISEQEFLHTPFALGIRCPWCTPGFLGSNGHVVASRGDGKQTAECGGHATGCYHGWATGRGFTFWMKYPGLDYRTTPPPLGDIDMFVQAHHYDEQGNITGPATASTPADRASQSPVVVVSASGDCIEARNGASIAGDHAADDGHPYVLRRWYPQTPVPAGQRFVGVAFSEATNVEPRAGGVAFVSDRTTRRFYLS